MSNLTNVSRLVFQTPWAITPAAHSQICSIVNRKVSGESLSCDEIQALVGGRASTEVGRESGGAIAVVPVHGPIAQKMDLMSDISGGTSTDALVDTIEALVADRGVSEIVLDIDSPGGSVFGLEELSDVIFEARNHKTITALANSFAASAAYWIGSQASRFVVAPGGEVGSIGVVMAHDDFSEAMAAEGVKRTYITTSKYKAEGNPYEPLSDEAKSALLADAETYHEKFVETVARGRGVSEMRVSEEFGQGRMLTDHAALSAGMVDEIGTLRSVIRSIQSGESARAQNRAVAAKRRYEFEATARSPKKISASAVS